MRIGDIPVGDGAPLVLITGVNVIESEGATLAQAHRLREIADVLSRVNDFRKIIGGDFRKPVRSEKGRDIRQHRVAAFAARIEHGFGVIARGPDRGRLPESYRAERDALLAGLGGASDEERQAALEELRRSRFDENEARRVRALDGV